jgi:hypothetical protein
MVTFERIWKQFFIYSILLIALMTIAGFLSQWELEERLQGHLQKDALVFAKVVAKALPDSESPDLLDFAGIIRRPPDTASRSSIRTEG